MTRLSNCKYRSLMHTAVTMHENDMGATGSHVQNRVVNNAISRDIVTLVTD